MTKESLLAGIGRLIEKRKSLPPFDPRQDEINAKLDKLYYHWTIMLEQENK
jgi:hypothetical protein